MWGHNYKKHRKYNERYQNKIIKSMTAAQEYLDNIKKEREDRRVKWMLFILFIAITGLIVLSRYMHYKEKEQMKQPKIEVSE